MKQIITGFYQIHVGNYDWGAAVDRVFLFCDQTIPEIDDTLFHVQERKMAGDEEKPNHDLYEVIHERKIISIYYCDENGEKTTQPGPNLALDLMVSPTEGSPFACSGKLQLFHWSDPYELTFSYEGNMELSIDPVCKKRITAADMFSKKTAITSSGIPYDYAEYIPKQATDTLFVWLHGLGEGCTEGSDVYLPILGRRGTSMASDAFQSTIGSAVVLVPQCPTYWMDAKGDASNFGNSLIEADGTSYYTDSLDEFIDQYAAKMQAKHIVLAGCSNGGYMCLMLAIKHPEKYAAIVPICEAVPDSAISDETIQSLVNTPLYFVYSKDDPIVVPEIHEIPTIERLKKAGCKDLHASVSDHVYDTSGCYKDEKGNPYQYMGHLSWIYYDNNETDDGNGLSAWEWIAKRLGKHEM
ncbi:MAG: hypothetical protein Q4E53_03400 [Eubacteriales bacterium]|nr:hypothetical protein [Eubacteriales bacterium]